MSEKQRRRAGLLVAVAAVLTLGSVAAALWWPHRLGVDDWAWQQVADPVWDRALYSLVAFALIGLVVAVTWGRVATASRREEAALAGLLVGLGLLAQIMVGQQARAGYHESVIAIGLPGANAYHEEARRIERLAPYLEGFEREVRRRPFRVQLSTHPAGPVLLMWGLNHVFEGNPAGADRFIAWCERWLASGVRLTDSPAAERLFADMAAPDLAGVWLATLLLRLAGSLAVVPAYLMAREWHGRHAALVAGAFSATIPSLLLFSPILDQAFPVLAALACWLSYAAGRRGSAWHAALAGLVVSAGLFLTLAFTVVAAWAGALAIAGAWRETPPRRRDLARLLAAAAGGLLLLPVVLYAGFRYRSLAVWWACWQGNAEFNLLTRRTYWKWLLVNPVEFLAFLGVPLACLFARRVATEAWALAHLRLADRDWPTVIAAGLLLALDLLGANLGEVARLWMFLMPACAVAGAAELGRYAPYRRSVFIALFALQSAQLCLFRASINVLNIK